METQIFRCRWQDCRGSGKWGVLAEKHSNKFCVQTRSPRLEPGQLPQADYWVCPGWVLRQAVHWSTLTLISMAAFQHLPLLPWSIVPKMKQLITFYWIDWGSLSPSNKLRFDQSDDPSCLLENKPKYWVASWTPSLSYISVSASSLHKLNYLFFSLNHNSEVSDINFRSTVPTHLQ